MNRDDRNTLLLLAAVLITAPLWIIPGVIYMIATGRTPQSCGEESNEVCEHHAHTPR